MWFYLNKKVQALFLSLGLILILSGIAHTQEYHAIDNQFIIKFSKNTPAEYYDDVRQALGVAVVKDNNLTGSEFVKAKSNNSFNHKLAKDLLAAGFVEYIEPNFTYSIEKTPNDPDYSSLWGLHNTGQSSGTANVDIDAPEAWDITTGNS